MQTAALIVRALLVGSIAVAASGCFDPDLTGEGGFSCPDESCPEGFSCSTAGLCEPVDGAPPTSGTCSASAATEISETTPVEEALTVSGSIAVALDESEPTLVVNYPVTLDNGASGVFFTRLGLGNATQQWEEPTLWANLPALDSDSVEGLPDYFTAVDAQFGVVLLLYGAPWSAADTKLGFLTVTRLNPTVGEILTLERDANDPKFLGTYPAVQISGTDVVIVGQSVADPSAEDQKLTTHAFEIKLTSDQQLDTRLNEIPTPGDLSSDVVGGTLTRLTEGPTVGGLAPITLAFVSHDLDSGERSLVVAERTGFGRWGPPSTVSTVAPLLDYGLADDGAINLVIPGVDADVEPHFLLKRGEASAVEIRPGGADVVATRATLAVREGWTGVAYVDLAGKLWLTARSGPQQPWQAALSTGDDTSSDEQVEQVEIVASEATDTKAVFQLVYLRRVDSDTVQLFHRSVTCQR